MADATAEVEIKIHGPYESVFLPVAATTTLYRGTFCAEDAGGDMAVGGDDAGANRAYLVLGTVDNSAGADADKSVEVMIRGTFSGHAVGTLTKAETGQNVAIADNQTITSLAAATNDVIVGRFDGFDPEDSTPRITV